MGFFIWLEGTAPSVWIRETPSLLGFPFILYLHTLGLALIAGLSSAVALTILLVPEQAAGARFARLFPWIWAGLAINVASGLALLLAYPAKALTNPDFYLKLISIGIAVAIVGRLARDLRAPLGAGASGAAGGTDIASLRRPAWMLLGLWAIAIVTGRLLAYTHSILMASDPQFF